VCELQCEKVIHCVCVCGGDTSQYACGNVSVCDVSICECEYVCVNDVCVCVGGGYESVCVWECVCM